jgi:hypothetical protein
LLADFSMAVLQERLRSATELEGMVRSHNRVIEAIHAQQAILPAKFGSVYARAGDVVSAIQPARETLLRQLHRVEGCDEWAVHVYADRSVIRERISAEDPTIQRLRAERDAARPGRAYFLDRQIRDELDAATQRELVALAQTAFDRMVEHAVAGHIDPAQTAAASDVEVEILRAAFLVARDAAARFEDEVFQHDVDEGLRCDCSGPWPPYSFAVREEVKAG